MRNQAKTKQQPKIEKRPVDVVLEEYNSFHTNSTNRIISYFSIPLMSFGLLAFIWSIPFPHFDFLGRYNGFINWASFLVAGIIYYYLRLSPLMSYAILFVLAAFSYLIVSLEKTVVLAQVGLFLGILGSVAQLIGYNKEGKRPLFAQDLKFMAIGPMWLFSLLFKKLNLRY